MLLWLKSTQTVATAAFLIGGLALVISDELALPFLTPVGILILAAAPILLGLHVLVTGRFRIPAAGRTGLDKEYTGIGAAAWGVLLLLAGAATAIYGAQQLLGSRNVVGEYLERWPGLAVALVGFCLALFGVAVASNPSTPTHRRQQNARGPLSRLRGAFIAFLGVVLIAGGFLHTLAPSVSRNLWNLAARALLSILQR